MEVHCRRSSKVVTHLSSYRAVGLSLAACSELDVLRFGTESLPMHLQRTVEMDYSLPRVLYGKHKAYDHLGDTLNLRINIVAMSISENKFYL